MKKYFFLIFFAFFPICIFSQAYDWLEEWELQQNLTWTSKYDMDLILLDKSRIRISVVLGYKKNDKSAERELSDRDSDIKLFLTTFISQKIQTDFLLKNRKKMETEIINTINYKIFTSRRIRDAKISCLPDKQEISISSYGYKEFLWGMSIEDVNTKCKDLKQSEYNQHSRWRTPEDALSYFYKNEVISYDPRDPNPLDYVKYEVEEYKSEDHGLTFYFVGEKLRAVHISFMGENIYPILEKKYGKSAQILKSSGSIVYNVVVWKDTGRTIVWKDGIWGIETVDYIDSKWLNPLIEKAMAEYLQKDSAIKSRID